MMLDVPSAFHQQIVLDFAYQVLSVSWKHTKVSLSEENEALFKNVLQLTYGLLNL